MIEKVILNWSLSPRSLPVTAQLPAIHRLGIFWDATENDFPILLWIHGFAVNVTSKREMFLNSWLSGFLADFLATLHTLSDKVLIFSSSRRWGQDGENCFFFPFLLFGSKCFQHCCCHIGKEYYAFVLGSRCTSETFLLFFFKRDYIMLSSFHFFFFFFFFPLEYF